jgi:hypothetical protein
MSSDNLNADNNSERRQGRLGRTIDRQRDDFFKQRKLVDDWAMGRGALVLLGMTALLVIFFVLAAFRVPL